MSSAPMDYEFECILDVPGFIESLPHATMGKVETGYLKRAQNGGGSPMIRVRIENQGHYISTLVFGEKEDEFWFKLLQQGDLLIVHSLKRSTDKRYRDQLRANTVRLIQQNTELQVSISARMQSESYRADTYQVPQQEPPFQTRRVQLPIPGVNRFTNEPAEKLIPQQSSHPIPCSSASTAHTQREFKDSYKVTLSQNHHDILDRLMFPGETVQQAIRRCLEDWPTGIRCAPIQKRA